MAEPLTDEQLRWCHLAHAEVGKVELQSGTSLTLSLRQPGVVLRSGPTAGDDTLVDFRTFKERIDATLQSRAAPAEPRRTPEQAFTQTVLDSIARERDRQRSRHGYDADHDAAHDRRSWAWYLGQRVHELAVPFDRAVVDERRQLVEVAAIAVAAIEAHDRRQQPEVDAAVHEPDETAALKEGPGVHELSRQLVAALLALFDEYGANGVCAAASKLVAWAAPHSSDECPFLLAMDCPWHRLNHDDPSEG